MVLAAVHNLLYSEWFKDHKDIKYFSWKLDPSNYSA